MRTAASGVIRLAALAAALLVAAPAAFGTISKGNVTIRLDPVANGLTAPNLATHAGDGSGRLFIVDQQGPIRILKDGVLLPTPFLDLSSAIPALAAGFDERGVLGLAFHPDYAQNGRFFVRYSVARVGGPAEPCTSSSRGCHEEVLAEFAVSTDPDVAGPTPTVLFRIDQPQFNHNAGSVEFGPDGLLYFSLGDGGGAHDGLADTPPSHGPAGHGQNIETALGAILRIDVDAATPYAIPPDNPFVGGPGVDEIFAYGLRNPYRFAFDDGPGGDGRLLLADVGQNAFEEINVIESGGNYGWVIREGLHCFDPFDPTNPPPSCPSTGPLGEPLLDPIAEYSHDDGGISIIGGYVYRGAASPRLEGKYVFGDFSAQFFRPGGRLYFLDETSPGAFDIVELRNTLEDRPYGRFLKGFGEDEDGEIYVIGSTALGPVGATGVVERLVVVEGPDLAIKPGSCPNPVNVGSQGRTPMGLLGTAFFDVSTIDPASLALVRDGALAASLDGDQANGGAGTGSTATGQASVRLDADTNELCMDLSFSGLLGTQTVQHVHGPATASGNAGILFGIPGPGDFADFCTVLTDEQERIMQDGLAYINIHSTRDPGGEIRGQILPARVAPASVHVEDVGTPSDVALCGCEESGPDGIPDLSLTFDTQEMVAALGLDGAEDRDLVELSVGGSVLPSTGSGSSTFRFPLDGTQEVGPNNSLGGGDCTVTLDEGTGAVTASCTYAGLSGSAIAAHIHGLAPRGVNAGVIVPLSAAGATEGTISGGGTLTPAQVQGMLDGLTYVNLHTDLFPGGELRGQVEGGEAFRASDCARIHVPGGPHRPAFWARQCAAAGLGPSGRGPRSAPAAPEPDFEAEIVAGANESLAGAGLPLDACSQGILADPASDLRERAIQELTALFLNIRSGRVAESWAIDVSSDGCTAKKVRFLVDELVAHVASGDDASLRLASACASSVNSGAALAAGESLSVSLASTADVAAPGSGWAPAPAPATTELLSRTDTGPTTGGMLLAHPPAAAIEIDAPPTDPREEDGETTVQRALDRLAEPAADREAAVDMLLTALSGGHELAVRLRVAERLAPVLDDALLSLLAAHVDDIHAEAAALGDEEAAGRAQLLRRRLERALE